MTENEAKIFIEKAMEQSKKALAELLLAAPKVFAVRKDNLGEYYGNLENCKKEIQACEVAVKALEEVQHWHTSVINPKIKNVFANSSTQICQNCDHKDEYIEELEAEVEQYRAIGTPEECKAATEKQTAKQPYYEGDGYASGQLVYDTWICPCCGKHYEVDYDDYDFCPNCGQKIESCL